jgi:hypothetical protein
VLRVWELHPHAALRAHCLVQPLHLLEGNHLVLQVAEQLMWLLVNCYCSYTSTARLQACTLGSTLTQSRSTPRSGRLMA